MEYLSRRAQIGVVAVAAILMLAILVSILFAALQAAQEGAVERAQQIIAVTALALVGLGVLALVPTTLIFLMYVPTKKVFRELREELPGCVVFMVTAPAHHSLRYPDYANAPEIDLPFAIAAVFSASPDGIAWWTRNAKNEPEGFVPRSRIQSLDIDDSLEPPLQRLVVELSDPRSVKMLTVIDERSNGFKVRQPEDMEGLVREIESVLESGRRRDGGSKRE